ncbi:hypothetical protein TNCV_4296261 [Trichonephila clavipes]|nr:hypothetical protein TNCV_4296261 [Trichonephila clavipes]
MRLAAASFVKEPGNDTPAGRGDVRLSIQNEAESPRQYAFFFAYPTLNVERPRFVSSVPFYFSFAAAQ